MSSVSITLPNNVHLFKPILVRKDSRSSLNTAQGNFLNFRSSNAYGAMVDKGESK